jgi:hypothetical protein
MKAAAALVEQSPSASLAQHVRLAARTPPTAGAVQIVKPRLQAASGEPRDDLEPYRPEAGHALEGVSHLLEGDLARDKPGGAKFLAGD